MWSEVSQSEPIPHFVEGLSFCRLSKPDLVILELWWTVFGLLKGNAANPEEN